MWASVLGAVVLLSGTPFREVPSQSEFSQVKLNFIFEIQDYLTFPDVQDFEDGMMRTLFFQEGKIYSSPDWLNSKGSRCSLRIQIKDKSSTFVDKGSILVPISFHEIKNNAKFTNYIYSFVDFSTGKAPAMKKGWRPFELSCMSSKNLNYNQFKRITGNKIKMQLKIKKPSKKPKTLKKP